MCSRKSSDRNDEGTLLITEQSVEYCGSKYRYDWTIPTSEIAVIGEFTNMDGPWLPDHFFVFVVWNEQWHMAPSEAVGSYDVMSRLERMLGVKFSYGLNGVTWHASHVLWPTVLWGNNRLFRFVPITQRGWRRLLLFWIGEMKIELTDEVKSYLKSICPE